MLLQASQKIGAGLSTFGLTSQKIKKNLIFFVNTLSLAVNNSAHSAYLTKLLTETNSQLSQTIALIEKNPEGKDSSILKKTLADLLDCQRELLNELDFYSLSAGSEAIVLADPYFYIKVGAGLAIVSVIGAGIFYLWYLKVTLAASLAANAKITAVLASKKSSFLAAKKLTDLFFTSIVKTVALKATKRVATLGWEYIVTEMHQIHNAGRQFSAHFTQLIINSLNQFGKDKQLQVLNEFFISGVKNS